MSKLNNTQIKNAKSKNKPYSLSDGLGLSLLINPNGSKWWRFRFQFDGKAKMMSLGTYPDVSLSHARAKLMGYRQLVAQGINPIEQQGKEKKENDSVAFEELSKGYLSSIKENVSSYHYKRTESLLRLYSVPKLGNHPIKEVTHQMVQEIIVAISDAGKKESAQKCSSMLNQLFAYAKMRGIVEVNVCKLVETQGLFSSASKRHFPTITEPAQVKALLFNIKEFEGAHSSTKEGLLFMAYTSLRSTNIRHAKWDQIDFENRTMTIAKEEMKIEKRKLHQSEDFVLPLATHTMDLLDEAKRFSGHGKYIFPSIRGDRPMSENAMLVFIRTLGYTKDQFTPHGFRAMFATISNEENNGFDRDLIDAQLAHKVGGSVSQAYNRTDYFNRRIALAQWWADWLDLLSSN